MTRMVLAKGSRRRNVESCFVIYKDDVLFCRVVQVIDWNTGRTDARRASFHICGLRSDRRPSGFRKREAPLGFEIEVSISQAGQEEENRLDMVGGATAGRMPQPGGGREKAQYCTRMRQQNAARLFTASIVGVRHAIDVDLAPNVGRLD